VAGLAGVRYARSVAAPRRPGDLESPDADLAGALHEVANALTVVLGWAQSARDARAQDASHDVGPALDVVLERARQAHRIARRAIGATVDDRDAPRPVGAVVREALVGLEPRAAETSVQLVGIVPAEVDLILVPDADRVLQVLTNLLLNALHAGGPQTEVTVEAREDGPGFVVITVADQGPGVSASLRSALFAGGHSTRPDGAGIGLRHAHQLARSLGGDLALADVHAESAPHADPDRPGAKLVLRWPIASAVRPRSERFAVTRPLASGAFLNGLRVLVVEDDDAVVELLDTALGARGAEVVSIRHRSELEATLQTGRFDVALFDISPIKADPGGALLAVREKNPAARLVLISGSALQPPPMPDNCRPGWVRKPFEISEIVEAILREPRPDD